MILHNWHHLKGDVEQLSATCILKSVWPFFKAVTSHLTFTDSKQSNIGSVGLVGSMPARSAEL